MPVPTAARRRAKTREQAAAEAANLARRQELIRIFAEMRGSSPETGTPPLLPGILCGDAGVRAGPRGTPPPTSPSAAKGGRRSRNALAGRAEGDAAAHPKVAVPAATAAVGGHGSTSGGGSAGPAQASSAVYAAKGGGALFTRSGRPLILSANSRRLPRAFGEQRQNAAAVELAIANVGATLQSLTRDLSRASDIQLPPATLAAVEDNHRAFTDVLALRAGASARGKDGAATQGMLSLPYTLRGKKATSDWLMRLQRARAAAADECLSDMQSVADYAGEPSVPRLAKDRTVRDELMAMKDSLEKIEVCGAAMRVDVSGNARDAYIPGSTNAPSSGGGDDAVSVRTEDHASGSLPAVATGSVSRLSGGDGVGERAIQSGFGASSIPWWSSALRTRDLKAHSIRLNFHARKALQWDWRCREHLLLQSTYLNRSSSKCRDDFLHLQAQLSSFAKRQEDSEVMTRALQEETVQLQQELAEAMEQRAELQERLVVAAQENGLLGEGDMDPLSAELALLLAGYTWPEELEGCVATVLAWLRAESTPSA